jgi:hypothetical protein
VCRPSRLPQEPICARSLFPTPDSGDWPRVAAELAGERRWCSVTAADRVIRWTTALAVVGVAAVALVGSYELLMMVIRASQAEQDGMPDRAEARDPLQERAAEVFAGQLAADRVPSVRAIRAQFHVGQPRAQRLRDYLAAAAQSHGGSLAA